MRSSLVLCALLSAASGLTLRPCGRPTSRRAMLAGSLCAVVLPSFAEDAPGLAAPAAPAAPPQMYQNGLVAPELAPAPVAAAPTLAEPTEITRACPSLEPSLERSLKPSSRACKWRLTSLLARGLQVLCTDAEDHGVHVGRVRRRQGRVHQLQRRRGLRDRAWAQAAHPWHSPREPQQRPAALTCRHGVPQPWCLQLCSTCRRRRAACPGLERHRLFVACPGPSRAHHTYRAPWQPQVTRAL